MDRMNSDLKLREDWFNNKVTIGDIIKKYPEYGKLYDNKMKDLINSTRYGFNN
jgi:hypothetical protein